MDKPRDGADKGRIRLKERFILARGLSEMAEMKIARRAVTVTLGGVVYEG